MKIETGWSFYSADFSIQASSDELAKGCVTLKRNIEETKKWHLIFENLQESDECPELYVYGFGITFEEALANANLSASQAKPLVIDTTTNL